MLWRDANLSQESHNIFSSFIFHEFESMFLGVAIHIQSRCKTHVLQPPKFEEQQHFHIFSGRVYFCNCVKSKSQSCKVGWSRFFLCLDCFVLGRLQKHSLNIQPEYTKVFRNEILMQLQPNFQKNCFRRGACFCEVVKQFCGIMKLWDSSLPSTSSCVSWDHWQSSSHAE